jgi:hypothetical protein
VTSEIGAVLAWDSEFFGFGIGRVTARQLTPHWGQPCASGSGIAVARLHAW